MIRTASSAPARLAAVSVVGIAGALVLAGCSTDTTDAEPAATSDTSSADTSTPDTSTSDTGTATGAYADGTYTAEGSYRTPESVETISVTVTLEGDVITDVEVTGEPTRRESEQYQSQFIGGIADVVVGESIDDIAVSRVAGSSLTSAGFNEAIEAIKAEAAA